MKLVVPSLKCVLTLCVSTLRDSTRVTSANLMSVIVSVLNKRESEIPVILNVDSMNTVMDLFGDTAAILNFIVLNIYYGMF